MAFDPGADAFRGRQLAARRPHHVQRVNQIDAVRLDDDINDLLRTEFAEIFKLWDSIVFHHLQPELDLTLRFLIWRYTVWIDAATPGGILQNVKYAQAFSGTEAAPKRLRRKQKLGLLLFGVAMPWLATRLHGVMRDIEGGAKLAGDGRVHRLLRRLCGWYLRQLLPKASAIISVCSAMNFLLFLRHGIFAGVAERLLAVRLVHIDPMAHRQVAFEYMNRIMLWNGISEFALTVAPLINLGKIWRRLTKLMLPVASANGGEGRCDDVDAVGCALCGTTPCCVPMRADCGHLFCYFCLASEQMEQHPNEVVCPRCSSSIESFKHAS
eukprot:TRINITY_DN72301_c0_g1_i1.p1 TRINITY_DN72301_c0_g1~~TRINITY_DN72301_c0_g1_i1.p1  ORF type:complete len:325 (-),score=39.84 TRINITY_DN72301_c0_g1_i1:146-1120(-)